MVQNVLKHAPKLKKHLKKRAVRIRNLKRTSLVPTAYSIVCPVWGGDNHPSNRVTIECLIS